MSSALTALEVSTTWATGPSWSLCASSLRWLLAEIQHIGVDMEADVGQVLLQIDSWDVTAYGLDRRRWEEKKNFRKQWVTHNHLEPLNTNHCTAGDFAWSSTMQHSLTVAGLRPWMSLHVTDVILSKLDSRWLTFPSCTWALTWNMNVCNWAFETGKLLMKSSHIFYTPIHPVWSLSKCK